ncbi:hypothetical protein PILCRDRAFT_733 [Piloderma croceum F 1598]|uniref:BTB domain-containing protein n=1 Tax=Piloderma croceum (strain F 1598) TaxID=765440 RepID=A0A0C3G5P6_PILCF|nr:hypothetical protein PILCRDRAFT_733 [Piloderma croceum F 1598]
MSDSAEQRPAKRPRTNASNAVPSPGDPWLDDGNIILQAESTQFRVVRSILSASSSVFGDMFSFPQPENENLVYGCPVVHVSDTAEDLHHVLKALYCFVDNEPLPLVVIAAFLRLGRKYNIQQLYSEALKRLEFEFPSTFEEYDRSSGSFTLIDVQDVGHDASLFAVINLARENDILHILPAAFYIACTCLNGKEFIEAMESLEAPTHELSVFDQRVVIKGWHSIVEKQAKTTFRWLVREDIFAPICTTDDCTNGRKDILIFMWFPKPDCMGLTPWLSWWNANCCNACIRKSKGLHDSGRRKIWEELPLFFGLPGWEELTKKK